MTKTINTCLAIGLEIHNPKLTNAKKLLIDKYNSVFNSSTHITLAITPMPEQNLKDCINELEKAFSKIRKIDLKLEELVVEQNNGVLQIPITINEDLMKIHKNLVEITNNFRDGYIREKDSGKPASENIVKYGYERVMDKFHPQISLGKISTDRDFEKIELELQPFLSGVTNNSITTNELYVVFYEDGNDQNKMKTIWEKTYYL